MAELHEADRAALCHGPDRHIARHGARRGPLQRGRRPPRPSLRRRPAADRHALLHQFGVAALHAPQAVRCLGGGACRRTPRLEVRVKIAFPMQPVRQILPVLLLFSMTFTNSAKAESVVLGGGCFWCLDATYKLLPGVTHVTCGYSGGTLAI